MQTSRHILFGSQLQRDSYLSSHGACLLCENVTMQSQRKGGVSVYWNWSKCCCVDFQFNYTKFTFIYYRLWTIFS